MFTVQVNNPGRRLHSQTSVNTGADAEAIFGEAMAIAATTAGEVTIKATITLIRAITKVKFAGIQRESQTPATVETDAMLRLEFQAGGGSEDLAVTSIIHNDSTVVHIISRFAL